MIFNSFEFLVFFPVVLFLYYIIPYRFRWIMLLVASYYFYMSWNIKYSVLIIFSTISTYFIGLAIDYFSNKEFENKLLNLVTNKKFILFFGLSINLVILIFFKYYNFLNNSLGLLFNKIGLVWNIPNSSYLLPVGISFYTFQAIGYIIDVYRGNKKAEKHIGIYALYVSFFPQLVAGPIERSTHLLPQFYNKVKFDYEIVKRGLLIMLWGFFIKMVIADRLAILVNTVYNDPNSYEGFQLIIATIFFTFQILCDFSGYTYIAIGISKTMGFDLMKNFNNPYFATSIKDFWKRWHISLSTWFMEYLYFPLGGSKGTKWFTYRNMFIVFLVSGLWHGARWTFVIWGILHGIYIIVEDIIKKYNIYERFLGIKDSISLRIVKNIIVFILVSFAWIFFRANGIKDTFIILKKIVIFNPVNTIDKLYDLGLDKQDVVLSLIVIFSMLLINFSSTKYDILRILNNLWLPFRWLLYIILIFSIIIFGVYGSAYKASDFIYFQF